MMHVLTWDITLWNAVASIAQLSTWAVSSSLALAHFDTNHVVVVHLALLISAAWIGFKTRVFAEAIDTSRFHWTGRVVGASYFCKSNQRLIDGATGMGCRPMTTWPTIELNSPTKVSLSYKTVFWESIKEQSLYIVFDIFYKACLFCKKLR